MFHDYDDTKIRKKTRLDSAVNSKSRSTSTGNRKCINRTNLKKKKIENVNGMVLCTTEHDERCNSITGSTSVIFNS